MDAQILRFVRLGLEVITDRLITVLALLSSGGLACWVMWGPVWERVSTLAIYVIFAYLVVRIKGEKHGHDSKGQDS